MNTYVITYINPPFTNPHHTTIAAVNVAHAHVLFYAAREGMPPPEIVKVELLAPPVTVTSGRVEPRQPARATCGTGAFEIERHRQKMEGLIPASATGDDKYAGRELIAAAMCIAENIYGADESPAVWPWAEELWKPSPDPQRNLENAGALLAAEWDRLERLKGGVKP